MKCGDVCGILYQNIIKSKQEISLHVRIDFSSVEKEIKSTLALCWHERRKVAVTKKFQSGFEVIKVPKRFAYRWFIFLDEVNNMPIKTKSSKVILLTITEFSVANQCPIWTL
jgi:hypothetical protein